MFVPPSLKRTERTIIEELKSEDFEVIFSITNFDTQTKQVNFTISCRDSSKRVPSRAKQIVEKHIEDWKKTYT